MTNVIYYFYNIYFLGIWLDYIRFEQTDGSPKLIESIYTRGLWKLEPNLRNFFIDEYDNIKREFMLVLYIIFLLFHSYRILIFT